jgi:hypothetical protein
MSDLYLARHPGAASRRLDDEMIVMAARDSSLFTLNETAAEIWEAADGQTPLAAIVRERICARFQVEFEQAYRDAEEFARALAEHGVLILSETPIAGECGA